MKRQSAMPEIKDKPPCHPDSHYRPLVFTENGKTYLSNRISICSACMHDKDSEIIKVPTIQGKEVTL